MNAAIPFAFLAGEQLHGAGTYRIRVSLGSKFVELRRTGSAGAARVPLTGTLVACGAGRDGAEGFLRFAQYGMAYALKAVVMPGCREALSVLPSRVEPELEKANGGAIPVTVAAVR